MIWLDTETRSLADVTQCGIYRMAEDPTLRMISIHYAFDAGPVQHWRGLFANTLPETADTPPFELWDRVRAGEEIGIWNAAFERHVWNAVARRTPTMPMFHVKQLRCIATLARAHNMPAKLASASMWLPEDQRKLANDSFHALWRAGTPLGPEHAHLYQLMLDYGDMDVVSMRALAGLMFDFDEALLRDYEVSEAVNDRGVGIDLQWCRRAVELKEVVEQDVEARLVQLTSRFCSDCKGLGTEPGKRPGTTRQCGSCKGTGRWEIASAKQPAKLREWVIEALEGAGAFTDPEQFQKAKKRVKADGTGYFSEIRKSFDKNVRAKLRDWIDERGVEVPMVGLLLDLVDEGSGAASSKYQSAIDRTSEDGALRGMYILDGAAQTGRFASVGMQTHNMIRKVLDEPSEAMELIHQTPTEEVKALCWDRWGLPVNDALGRLLRPSLVPRRTGRVLIWGDWSAVEARVCPWLSGSPKAEPVLNLFRSGKDVYLSAASDIVGHPVTDKKDPARQLGKVAVLSLGFGGAVGAYVAMARNYGVEGLPASQVKGIVDAWRAANPWAREWWDALETAARAAFRYPGKEFPAGRVTFTFMPGRLDGCLVMWLPCGRPLFYPAAEIRMGQRFEDEPAREVITFVHAAFGRIPLWYGQLAENATQGTAASLLRRTLSMLHEGCYRGAVVGHTHDEIIVECEERDVRGMAEVLQAVMEDVPEWAPGLPLAAEVSAGFAYYEPAPELLGGR